jgi:hypothetical protein
MRLLALGWCEHITYNQKLNKIVDGHGRVLASKWLSERSPDWFALQLKFAQQRGISEADAERYSPLYWNQVSIIATTLTDDDHAAMNLGLNAEKAFGVDDPDKVKKLLDGLDDEERAIAGFSAKVKAAVKDYAESAIAHMEDNEFQDKQYFERPDAIDYSVRDKDEYMGESPVTVSNSDDDDDYEPVVKDVFVPKILNLALPWGDWKKWKAWKQDNGIDKDADAYWKGLQQAFPDDLSFAAKKD